MVTVKQLKAKIEHEEAWIQRLEQGLAQYRKYDACMKIVLKMVHDQRVRSLYIRKYRAHRLKVRLYWTQTIIREMIE